MVKTDKLIQRPTCNASINAPWAFWKIKPSPTNAMQQQTCYHWSDSASKATGNQVQTEDNQANPYPAARPIQYIGSILPTKPMQGATWTKAMPSAASPTTMSCSMQQHTKISPIPKKRKTYIQVSYSGEFVSYQQWSFHMEKQATLTRLSVVNRSLKVARKFTAVKSQQLGKMVKNFTSNKMKHFHRRSTRYMLPFSEQTPKWDRQQSSTKKKALPIPYSFDLIQTLAMGL